MPFCIISKEKKVGVEDVKFYLIRKILVMTRTKKITNFLKSILHLYPWIKYLKKYLLSQPSNILFLIHF